MKSPSFKQSPFKEEQAAKEPRLQKNSPVKEEEPLLSNLLVQDHPFQAAP